MKRLAFAALALSGACWGIGFPLGKLALQEVEAAHLILLRFAVAGAAALPLALGTPEARALFRSPWVLLAGLLYGVAFLVQFQGLAETSVTLSALLVGVMPALIAVSAFLLREPVSRTSWLGVIAATAGAALIAGRPGTAGTPMGIALSLAALLIFLAWLLVLRRAPKGASALAVSAVTIVVAAVAILPIAFVMHGAPRLDLKPQTWASIVGLGLLCTLLATAAWQYGSARVSSASAGVFINMEPLMGAVIGVALFGDDLTMGIAAGGLLILVGSLTVVRGEKDTAAPDLADPPPTPA